MRRRAKVDANQREIIAALLAEGASVLDLSGVGNGCPDIAVGNNLKTVFMEIKDGSKPPSARRLTPAQLEFHRTWQGGPIAVVCDVESALRVLKVMEA